MSNSSFTAESNTAIISPALSHSIVDGAENSHVLLLLVPGGLWQTIVRP
jgi:hypothetical protein